MTKPKSGLENLADAMEASVYAELEQEYLNQLPEWAIERAYGNYHVGAQLPTKDGRRIGNAHLIDITYPGNVDDERRLYRILTDAGTEIIMNAKEIDECFYPPEWVSDIKEVIRKFGVPRQ